MSDTLKDLTETVTELRHQIRPLCKTNPRFEAIDQKLADILVTIEQRQLSLQVFSQNVHQAERVANLLNTQSELASACRIFSASQPRTWSLDPSIITPALRFNRSSQHFLSLNPAQVYTLGRAEQCSLQVDNSHLFVSGEHCRVEYHPSTAAWTIEDTSKNGTFINGERLSQKHELRSGDRIILGSEKSTEESFNLLFDDPFNQKSKVKLDSTFIDFDIACFGFTFNQELTESEKHKIGEIKKLVKTNLYGLVEVDVTNSADSTFTNVSAKAFIDILKKDTKISSSRLGYVSLRSHLEKPESGLSKNKYTLQECLNTIQQSLQENYETLLLKRLKPQINHLSTLIARLNTHEEFIAKKLSQHDALEHNQQNNHYLNLQVQQALNLIKSQSDVFFKQAESYLNQAEKVNGTFFDELCVDSLSYKMQVFSRSLTFQVSKHGNKKLLRLKYVSTSNQLLAAQSEQREASKGETPPKVIDANIAMLNFCEYELYLWSKEVWHEIYSDLASGGLRSLHNKIFTALELFPIKELSTIKEQYDAHALDLHGLSSPSEKFTQAPEEVVIKEPSAISYLMKKIRSQWMQFIFLFSFFSILGIAGRRQIMRNLMAPIINIFDKAPIISGLLLISFLFMAVKFGLKIHQEDLEEARSKQADDLRTKLCKHYQELVKKYLVKSYLKIVKEKLEEEQNRIGDIQIYLEDVIKTSV